MSTCRRRGDVAARRGRRSSVPSRSRLTKMFATRPPCSPRDRVDGQRADPHPGQPWQPQRRCVQASITTSPCRARRARGVRGHHDADLDGDGRSAPSTCRMIRRVPCSGHRSMMTKNGMSVKTAQLGGGCDPAHRGSSSWEYADEQRVAIHLDGAPNVERPCGDRRVPLAATARSPTCWRYISQQGARRADRIARCRLARLPSTSPASGASGWAAACVRSASSRLPACCALLDFHLAAAHRLRIERPDLLGQRTWAFSPRPSTPTSWW